MQLSPKLRAVKENNSSTFVLKAQTSHLHSDKLLSMSGPQKYSRQDFLKVFPSLVEDIKQSATQYNVPQNALDWLEKVRE